jgi:hypothetical protein
LKVFQQVLDDQVKSYTKAVGGNPDDVGLALEEVLRLTFNLNKE